MNETSIASYPFRVRLYNEAMQWLLASEKSQPNDSWTSGNSGFANPQMEAQYRVWRAQLAMSCELFLKFLYAESTSLMPPQGHKLVALYDDLSSDVRLAIDTQFLDDCTSNRLRRITIDGHWIESIPEQRHSASIKCDTFRGLLELLDRLQVDFEERNTRYQYEHYKPGAFVVVLSPEATQIVETLQRCAFKLHRDRRSLEQLDSPRRTDIEEA